VISNTQFTTSLLRIVFQKHWCFIIAFELNVPNTFASKQWPVQSCYLLHSQLGSSFFKLEAKLRIGPDGEEVAFHVFYFIILKICTHPKQIPDRATDGSREILSAKQHRETRGPLKNEVDSCREKQSTTFSGDLTLSLPPTYYNVEIYYTAHCRRRTITF